MGYKTFTEDPEYTRIIRAIIEVRSPSIETVGEALEYPADGSLIRHKLRWLKEGFVKVGEKEKESREVGRPRQKLEIDWEAWAQRIVSKVMKQKLEPADYVSIGLVFEKFFKNSLRLRGKSGKIPSLNTLEDQFISFVGLVTFKTGYEVEGLDAFAFSHACAMKLYLELDSKCGGLARQGVNF